MPATHKIILLTGASGFIGANFLKQIAKKNWRIRVLLRNPKNWVKQDGVEIIKGNLENTVDWSRAVEGVEVVVHTAAEIKDIILMPIINVLGSERLLQAAINAGVKRWVQLSSVGSYGPVVSGVVSEDWPDNPHNPYEVSKTDFDKILKQAAQSYGIEVCIVRPSNVYGADMRNQSIQQILSAMQKNLFAFIGSKAASANYVNVQDVVQALDLCVSEPKAANQTYIVSAWATMEEMVGGLASGSGLKPPSLKIPLHLATWLAKSMQWYPRWPLTLSRVQALSMRSRYSTKKIEKELGWKLTVSVREGMQHFARGLR